MNALLSFVSTSPLGQTALLVAVLSLGGVVAAWFLTGLLRDVWQLPMAMVLQPRIATAAIVVVGLTLFTVTGYVLNLDHIAGRLMITAACGARPALWLTRLFAWRAADADLRKSAAGIRNELANRLHERPVSTARSWPSFIFDVERVNRRASYEPPPI